LAQVLTASGRVAASALGAFSASSTRRTRSRGGRRPTTPSCS
jgi:hypothetical protein